MYHPKKFSTSSLVPHKAQGSEPLATVGGLGGSSVKNSNPTGGSGKQRLRWTSDLHDRFVDAITQLGGPDSGYFLLSIEYRDDMAVSFVNLVLEFPFFRLHFSFCCFYIVFYLIVVSMGGCRQM